MPDHDWLKTRAREMRRQPTVTERLLWALLRGHRLDGLKFRRQVPLGRYIADFACFSPRLIIEADGPTHENSAHDLERDAWLRGQGFTILRFRNADVDKAPERVLAEILRASGRK